MVEYLEQNTVAHSMMKHGGGFVSALGVALMKADRTNAQKIKDAFPEYWDEYLNYGQKKKD